MGLKHFHNQKLNKKFTTVILVPLMLVTCIFAGVLFAVMEQNVVSENFEYMQNSTARTLDQTSMKTESVNMTTQFFLSDEGLLDLLKRVAAGEELTASEWMEFKKNRAVALERLVYNNPLLYGVRVYAANDDVQEIMPILYGKTRMGKQDWAGRADESGWCFDYLDNTFDAYSLVQDNRLASLITEIRDRDWGRLGTIEAAMTMEDLFPSLYEGIEGEWSCFAAADGSRYMGMAGGEEAQYLDALLEEYETLPEPADIETRYLKGQNRRLIVSYVRIRELDGTLVCVKDITRSIHQLHRTRNLLLLLVLLLLFLACSHL